MNPETNVLATIPLGQQKYALAVVLANSNGQLLLGTTTKQV
jgi:hypothetical protein